MSTIFTPVRGRALLHNLLLITVGLGFTSALHAQTDLVPNQVKFRADRSLLQFPDSAVGIIFGNRGSDERNSSSGWLQLSHLPVDSVVWKATRAGVWLTTPVNDSADLTGFSIVSRGLQSVLQRCEPTALYVRFPSFNRADTAFWHERTHEWRSVPDLSTRFRIVLDPRYSVDSVVSWLKGVPGLRDVGPVPLNRIFIKSEDSIDVSRSPAAETIGWHLQERGEHFGVQATQAWTLLQPGLLGNVKIGQVEQSVETTHEDLSGTNHGLGSPNSHATKDAGVMCAAAFNGVGVAGVAPNGHLHTFCIGSHWDDIIAAVNEGCKVVLLPYSFRYPYADTTDAKDALITARAHDVTVVTSAGDADHLTYVPQYCYPSVWDDLCVSVGAIGMYGDRASWSNYTCDTCTELVDVVAPGRAIATTALNNTYDYTFTGTCPASAIVAGIIALGYSVDPALTPARVEQLLEGSAFKDGLPTYLPREYGHGYADAWEFLLQLIDTNTTICGTLELLDPMLGAYEPLQDFQFDICRINGSDTTVLATAITDEYGEYEATIPAGNYLVFFSFSTDTQSLQYEVLSNRTPPVPISGTWNTNRKANPFYLDMTVDLRINGSTFQAINSSLFPALCVQRDIMLAHDITVGQYGNLQGGSVNPFGRLQVRFDSTNNVSTHFTEGAYSGWPYIYIAQDDYGYHTAAHEFGHCILWCLQGDDLGPGSPWWEPGMTYYINTVTDTIHAFEEGFAELVKAISTTPELVIEGGTFQDNIDINSYWQGESGNNSDGTIVSGAVASILYDLFDDAATPPARLRSEDYSVDSVNNSIYFYPIILDCIWKFRDSDQQTRSLRLFADRFTRDAGAAWWYDPYYSSSRKHFCTIYSTHRYSVSPDYCSNSYIADVVADDSDEPNLPGRFELRQNYPNPFNSGTRVQFRAPSAGSFRLEVCNVLGQLMYAQSISAPSAGVYHFDVELGAMDLSSGVYFYSVSFESSQQTRKMLYLK